MPNPFLLNAYVMRQSDRSHPPQESRQKVIPYPQLIQDFEGGGHNQEVVVQEKVLIGLTWRPSKPFILLDQVIDNRWSGRSGIP